MPRTPTRSPGIAVSCQAIETLFAGLRASGSIDIFAAVVPPQSKAKLAKLEAALDFKLPADVRRFLERGLDGGTGSVSKGDDIGAIGFDFMTADLIVKTTKMMRTIARDYPDDEVSQLILGGIVLSYSEPQIVIGANGHVYHFSFRNPLAEITDSFATFLAHWAASGCHSSHSFDLVWPYVEKLAPKTVPLANNVWLATYKRQFPDSVKRRR